MKSIFYFFSTFFQKALDLCPQKCDVCATETYFLILRCVSSKPINFGGHSAYHDRVLDQLRKYYPDASNSQFSSTWQILEEFWCLDLSSIDVLMQDRYSVFAPEPRLPSDMLRSILVSAEFKITSYTRFTSDHTL